jgi:hypothetical protein
MIFDFDQGVEVFAQSLDVIAIIISIWSAVYSTTTRSRTMRLEQEFTVQRDEAARRLEREDVMSRYREPILRSAIDLQSRLYNIDQNRFLNTYFNTSDTERSYALRSTLYVFAEYLGWVEILRREVQFLDLGQLEANQRLARLLETIATTMLTNQHPTSLRLFRGEQRAIGEIMLVARQGGGPTQYECLGFAAFTEKLEDESFAKWFANLERDVEALAKSDDARDTRLRSLQHSLIDLIDFLDPNQARLPGHRRKKLTLDPFPPSPVASADSSAPSLAPTPG